MRDVVSVVYACVRDREMRVNVVFGLLSMWLSSITSQSHACIPQRSRQSHQVIDWAHERQKGIELDPHLAVVYNYRAL